MLYIITDISLKVILNTNKTGHHVIRYNWHIVESGIQHHFQQHVMYNMVTSIIGVEHYLQ
jgi:hypothetical protein